MTSSLFTKKKKLQSSEEAIRKSPDITDRLRLLEQEVSRYREESRKSQAEVERLIVALRDAETDKTSRDRKVTDLERWESPTSTFIPTWVSLDSHDPILCKNIPKCSIYKRSNPRDINCPLCVLPALEATSTLTCFQPDVITHQYMWLF